VLKFDINRRQPVSIHPTISFDAARTAASELLDLSSTTLAQSGESSPISFPAEGMIKGRPAQRAPRSIQADPLTRILLSMMGSE